MCRSFRRGLDVMVVYSVVAAAGFLGARIANATDGHLKILTCADTESR